MSSANRQRQDEWTAKIAEDVIHVFEPTSEQSFLVNLRLLRNRIANVLGQGSSKASVMNGGAAEHAKAGPFTLLAFVRLFPGSSSEIIYDDQIPLEITQSLESLCSKLNFSLQDAPQEEENPTPPIPPLSILLEQNLHLGVIVPLAAVILDYSVAYVPEVGSGSTASSPVFLANVPVNTYEATLSFTEGNSEATMKVLSVLKFSCPRRLEEVCPERLSQESIVKGLESLLRSRLEEIGDRRIT
ncbi:hypothetical protein H1R20_g7328, partial [Candolleomyces eurysporus]